MKSLEVGKLVKLLKHGEVLEVFHAILVAPCRKHENISW